MEPKTACSPSREWGIWRSSRSSIAIGVPPLPPDRGLGFCAPHFLCLRQRKRAAPGPKEKRLGAKRHFVPFLLKYGGRARQCSRNKASLCWVRRTSQEQGTYSPHLALCSGFRDGRRMASASLSALISGLRAALTGGWPPKRACGRSRFAQRYRSHFGGVVQNRGPAGPLVWSFQGGVGETGEAPPAADEASLFRGSGAIGGPKGAGNRSAATVLKSRPRMFTRGLPTPFPLGVG